MNQSQGVDLHFDRTTLQLSQVYFSLQLSQVYFSFIKYFSTNGIHFYFKFVNEMHCGRLTNKPILVWLP